MINILGFFSVLQKLRLLRPRFYQKKRQRHLITKPGTEKSVSGMEKIPVCELETIFEQTDIRHPAPKRKKF